LKRLNGWNIKMNVFAMMHKIIAHILGDLF
jgi:hypothetical protein